MKRAGAFLTCASIFALLTACRSEPPPSLAVESSANPDTDVADPQPAPPPREDGPWFIDGEGARAMKARARGQHENARAALANLLDDDSLSAVDRAAAQLMDADSARVLDLHEAAAQGFEAAAATPELAPIADELRFEAAREWLAASAVDKAEVHLSALEPGPGIGAELWIARGDAAARLDQSEAAQGAYERYLQDGAGRRVYEARAKLARLLDARDDDASKKRAAELWARLAVDLPLSDYGEEAKKALADGGEARLKRSKAERQAAEVRAELAELELRTKRREYERVEKDAKKAAARKTISAEQRCEFQYLEGSAIFKQRDRPRARPVFEKAAKSCEKAKDVDREVKSRYQAARGRYAEGKYPKAAAEFTALAKDRPDHSYADDAWILAGEAWESAGKKDEARKAYEEAITRHPAGDMQGEARRRAVLLAFGDADPKVAFATVERALSAKGVGLPERAKLTYFRARARERLPEPDVAAIEADYLDAAALAPLSYEGLVALSRLHELGPESYAKGIAALKAGSGEGELPSLDLPGRAPEHESRAKLWARLGFSERAEGALEDAGVKGWPAVALLSESGDFAAAQRELANLGSGWRRHTPNEATRAHWELAHPRAFAPIIDDGEPRLGVPRSLTFAIMQTESRFNPDAVSWAGAQGLVQLMPATAKDLAQRAGISLKERSVFEPEVNLELGMSYLARLAGRYGGGPGGAALAAPSYNAGGGAVDRWVAERGDWAFDLFLEAIPYDESRRYAQSVMGRWFAYRWLYAEGDPVETVPLLPRKTPSKSE